MARAVKRPNLKLPAQLPAKLAARLPAKLPRPSLPRLPDPNEPDVFEEMTLLEHMVELRDRIVKVGIAIAIAFVAGIILANPLLQLIVQNANVPSGLDISSPADTIAIFFKIALYIAVGISTPIIVYQFVAFLAPGLTKREKRILYASLPFVSILFVGGAYYGFAIAAPRAFEFLSGFQTVNPANPEAGGIFSWDPDGNEVINFFLTLMIGLGMAFQIPVIMFLLAKLNVVTPAKMRGFRKYALLLILIVSAIITPSTDPINMAFVAVPLVLLYELGIVIAAIFVRGGPKPAAPAPA